jgi:hypothetical protein
MKSFFTFLFGVPAKIWAFYAPILRELFADAASNLLPLALDIVLELADAEKTSSQKREAAVKKLSAAATRNGIDASESLIRFTIESAVQRIKLR